MVAQAIFVHLYAPDAGRERLLTFLVPALAQNHRYHYTKV